MADNERSTRTARMSIVIPCRDGGTTLARQLEAIQSQDVDVACEVIVADNGSTDDSREIAGRYAGAAIPVAIADAFGGVGINHARNSGVRAARGEFVVLCDVDDVVQPGWLSAYWRAYRDGASIVGGTLFPATIEGRPLGLAPLGVTDGPELLPWPYGANCGFSRTVFDELGGFDEEYRGGGDEIEFFWRAQLGGHTLVSVPAAIIMYSTRTTSIELFRQGRGYGRGYARLFAGFRQRGMRRTSLPGALWFWTSFPMMCMLALAFPEHRRRFLIRFGSRVGTIEGSLRFRVFCP